MLRSTALLDAHRVIKEINEDTENEHLDVNKSFVLKQLSDGYPLAVKISRQLNIISDDEFSALQDNFNASYEIPDCEICSGIFTAKVKQGMSSATVEKQGSIEYSNYLVGSRINPRILENEEEMRVKFQLKWGESFKSHFNRFIGRELGKVLDKPVEFKNPDVVFMYIVTSGDDFSVEIQINPYFIYGKYKKLIRGIPQTHWPHRPCNGRGCEECDFSGKQYKESVEEFISGPALRHFLGDAMKFHGAGREDIDARMLGDGRPFVIEILNGKKRRINLKELEKEINDLAGGKIEVSDLRASTKAEMQTIKVDSANVRKRYRALCSLEAPLSDEMLETIKSTLEGTMIKQRTPERVAHRRADKVRTKEVHEFIWERLEGGENQQKIYLIIEAEGGTYIKELISSDNGRTNPSVTGIAGQQVTCIELDVLEVSSG